MVATQNKIKRNKDGTITGVPLYGDRPLAKTLGVRFSQEIFEQLEKLENKQEFIRQAVQEKLERES